MTVQSDAEIVQAVEHNPSYICETEPGDVIAFDLRLHHASINGRDRRQWTITYYRDPVGPDEIREVTAALMDDVEEWRDLDHARYPFYDPEWISEVEKTWRAPAIRRLRELGALGPSAGPEGDG